MNALNAPSRALPQRLIFDRRWLKLGVGSVSSLTVEGSAPVVALSSPKSARRWRTCRDALWFGGFLRVFGYEFFRDGGNKHRHFLSGQEFGLSLWVHKAVQPPCFQSLSLRTHGSGEMRKGKGKNGQLASRRVWKVGWRGCFSSNLGIELTDVALLLGRFIGTWFGFGLPAGLFSDPTSARSSGLSMGKERVTKALWYFSWMQAVSPDTTFVFRETICFVGTVFLSRKIQIFYVEDLSFLFRKVDFWSKFGSGMQRDFARFYGIEFPSLACSGGSLGVFNMCSTYSPKSLPILMIFSQAKADLRRLWGLLEVFTLTRFADNSLEGYPLQK